MTLRHAWLLAACLLYLLLAGYQLGLPGLHYDEAQPEAGVNNAMEMLTGAPVTAFHRHTVAGGHAFPLIVQDYIGALNVYLALPLLAATGSGVPNLRALPVLTGLLALLALERALAAWLAYRRGGFNAETGAGLRTPPIAVAGLVAVTILAASPAFVFWARQGVFVTEPDAAAGLCRRLAGRALAAHRAGAAPSPPGRIRRWPGAVCQAAGAVGDRAVGRACRRLVAVAAKTPP